MILKFRRFMKGRRGQGMSEYIIMVGLVAVAAIGIYTAFGKQIRAAVETMGLQLSGDTAATQTQNSDLGTHGQKDVTLEDFQN
jgi:Flp pilus assembly pilin Flp